MYFSRTSYHPATSATRQTAGHSIYASFEAVHAADTAAGALFTAAGQTLHRVVMKTQTTGRIWAEDPATGKRRDLTFEEHRRFWTWGMIEVLRHPRSRSSPSCRITA